MRSRFYVSLLAIILFTLPITAQKKSQLPEIPTVDFCELVNQPAKYDKKIIRISAIYSGGYHGSSLYDYRCQSGDANMSLGYEKSKIFKTKKSIKKRYDEVINSNPSAYLQLAYVTLIGRFNNWNGSGYGAFNVFRFEFTVMAYENIDPVDSSIPGKSSSTDFMDEIKKLQDIGEKWSNIYAGFYIKNADDIFAANYIFKNLQGREYDKEQFLKMVFDPKNATSAAIQSGKTFIEGDKAFIKGGSGIFYACPNTILFQFQYDNNYEKQDGVWKLTKAEITSDKTSMSINCH